MATTKSTRRGFLGTLGAMAAVPLIPGTAHAAPSGIGLDAMTAHGEALRAAYFAEVARFAETLRPRFESGELRAYRSPADDQKRIPGTTGWGAECFEGDSPQYEIERLAAVHFGLATTERPDGDGGAWIDGDAERGHLVLAASSHANVTGEGASHSCDHARESVSWDVIALARARGWYTPAEDEYPDPLDEAAEERGQA